MSQQKPLKQTQIAIGAIVKQNQEMDLTEEKQVVQLQDFIEIITRTFENSTHLDENTIAMTQGELSDKIKVASGHFFEAHDIISSMHKAGFKMQIVCTPILEPDFYWLFQPKKTIKN